MVKSFRAVLRYFNPDVSGALLKQPAATPQPDPVPGGVDIYPLVIEDIEARAEMGKAKYGTVLQSNNGRDALMDAYQEALDLAIYLRQALEEKK